MITFTCDMCGETSHDEDFVRRHVRQGSGTETVALLPMDWSFADWGSTILVCDNPSCREKYNRQASFVPAVQAAGG